MSYSTHFGDGSHLATNSGVYLV